MPNGLLDIGLGRSGPVVVGVDGSDESVAAAQEAAHEAVLRGAALDVVAAGASTDVPAQRSGADRLRAPVDLEQLAAALARTNPGLPVLARTLTGPAARALRWLSSAASLLVLGGRGAGHARGWASGSVAREVLPAASCPVLVAGPRSGFGRALAPVVVADVEDDEPAVPVMDVGAAQAVRRDADLLLVHPYGRRRAEEPGAALRRARARTAQALEALGIDSGHVLGVRVATLHTTAPAAEALTDHARDAELVVVGSDALARHAPTLARLATAVLVVPRGLVGRHESARAAYRRALVEELAATPERADGCATPEELDDAWRVGVAAPAVSDRVVLAWQACLQQAAAAAGVASRERP